MAYGFKQALAVVPTDIKCGRSLSVDNDYFCINRIKTKSCHEQQQNAHGLVDIIFKGMNNDATDLLSIIEQYE